MKHTSSPFKWRHYAPDVILLCVRWYLPLPALLPRSLEEMMRERGLSVDHVTIAPEDERHFIPHRRDVCQSRQGLEIGENIRQVMVVSLHIRGEIPTIHNWEFESCLMLKTAPA